MYKDYLKLAQTKTGKGVITTTVIPANVPILEFRGDLFTTENIKHDDSQIVQVGPNLFMGPSGDLDDFVNHSCNPNCYLHIVGNRAILYSMYVIPTNVEITFDYSTTSTDTLESWNMECHCGSFNCRNIISGFDTLNDEAKAKYKNINALPLYITHPNMIPKRI